jgi:hypothetical protein
MFRLPKFTIDWSVLVSRPARHLAVQLGGCAAVLAGVAHWSHAAAWVLGGLIAVIAIERQP